MTRARRAPASWPLLDVHKDLPNRHPRHHRHRRMHGRDRRQPRAVGVRARLAARHLAQGRRREARVAEHNGVRRRAQDRAPAARESVSRHPEGTIGRCVP